MALGLVQVHDWYDAKCCHDHDCRPIASCSEITEDSTGLTWQRFHFDEGQIKPSHDDKCHVCLHQNVLGKDMKPTPLCIYIQQGS